MLTQYIQPIIWKELFHFAAWKTIELDNHSRSWHNVILTWYKLDLGHIECEFSSENFTPVPQEEHAMELPDGYCSLVIRWVILTQYFHDRPVIFVTTRHKEKKAAYLSGVALIKNPKFESKTFWILFLPKSYSKLTVLNPDLTPITILIWSPESWFE